MVNVMDWLKAPVKPNPEEGSFWQDAKHRMAGMPRWQFAYKAPATWVQLAITEAKTKAYMRIYDALDHLYPKD